MAYLSPKDFLLEVAKGNIPKHSDYGCFGINEDIDIGTVPEDIYSAGGVYVPPTTYRTHNIVSTVVNDDGAPAGTGARTIRIFGVVSTGLATEDIIMNGTTNVLTVNSYSDIYRMFVLTAGASGTNEGVITATATTDGTVTATIAVNGFNSTRRAIRLIPPGYKGYIYDWSGDMTNAVAGSTALIYLLTKRSGGVWISRNVLPLSNSGTSGNKKTFEPMLVLDAGEFVKIQCSAVSNNNTVVSSQLNIVLVQD